MTWLTRPVPSDLAVFLASQWGATPPTAKAVWLRARLVEAVRTRNLAAGVALPGARDLAAALGISRGTVDAVYTQLTDEGFMIQEPRRRATVARDPGSGPSALAPPASAAPPPTPGVPDPGLFPHGPWSAASRVALQELTDGDLGYPDPSGHPRLRAVLADWLSRTRGVSASPDDIHVTSGVSHALWLLAHALDAGVWAVERPGSAGSAHVLGRRVTCRPVRIDGHGMIPNQIPHEAGAVLVTPSHQYPTGTLMPAERRRDLVDACREAGRWLVEDDYDSHLAAPGLVPAALQALAPDTVVLVGSLSKLLAPGLRLGWIVTPPSAAERLRELRQQTDLGVSVLTQLTVAHLIGSGGLDRHLRKARSEYAQRRSRLATALAPGWALSGAAVGVHAFVPTSAPDRLAAACADARLPSLTVDDQHWPGLVVSVAAHMAGRRLYPID